MLAADRFLFTALAFTAAGAVTHTYSPCSQSIYWEGRVQRQEAGHYVYNPACIISYDWNAVTFYAQIDTAAAGSFSAEINPGGKWLWLPIGFRNYDFVNRWLVKVRDADTNELVSEEKIELPTNDRLTNVTVATFKAAGRYVVSARKMNQPNLVIGSPLIEPNKISVHRFITSEGALVKEAAGEFPRRLFPSGRKLEVWGASDSSGFGADLYGSPSENKAACDDAIAEITNKYQNSDVAYSARLAEHFGAELHMHAVAGIGAERNAKWTEWWFETLIRFLSLTSIVDYVRPLPEYFGNTLATVGAGKDDWDFSRWKPDVVMVMLGGNDLVCSEKKDGSLSLDMPSDFSLNYVSSIISLFEKYQAVQHTPTIVSVCGFSSKSEDGTCNRNAACDAVSEAAVLFSATYKQWAPHYHYVNIPVGVVADSMTHGCAGHRTADGQSAVAQYLAPRLAGLLHWNPVTDALQRSASDEVLV